MSKQGRRIPFGKKYSFKAHFVSQNRKEKYIILNHSKYCPKKATAKQYKEEHMKTTV